MARLWSSDNCSSLHSISLCTKRQESTEYLCTGLPGGFTWRITGGGADSREDVVHTDNTVRSGGTAVVDDGGVALHPHPASML